MTMRLLPLLIAAATLAGCGSASQLKPAAGKNLPVAPYGVSTRPTSLQLLTPTSQERPQRSDELLTNSQARRSDEFDLPPQ
ncbi:hypothetical protein [Sphingomonas bacterium]|uniref:hypothetical protein n=1 Tax=Sphingomonas bacterium TaxID=1895847 RepID=UPI001575B364|nr:hypothetical protein [Sphingomonas bacterium]